MQLSRRYLCWKQRCQTVLLQKDSGNTLSVPRVSAEKRSRRNIRSIHNLREVIPAHEIVEEVLSIYHESRLVISPGKLSGLKEPGGIGVATRTSPGTLAPGVAAARFDIRQPMGVARAKGQGGLSNHRSLKERALLWPVGRDRSLFGAKMTFAGGSAEHGPR